MRVDINNMFSLRVDFGTIKVGLIDKLRGDLDKFGINF